MMRLRQMASKMHLRRDEVARKHDVAVEPSAYRTGDSSAHFEKLILADIESSQEQQEQSDEVGATESSILE